MQINLISCYYISDDEIRQNELNYCKEQNTKAGFDNLFFWGKKDLVSFNELFDIANEHPNDINVIANGDIFFESESIEQIKSFFVERSKNENKVCLALNRWEYSEDGDHRYIWSNQAQDVWCFYGKIEYTNETNFKVGTPGCDNRLAFELRSNMGYEVLNPSLSIKTIHYHKSGDTTRTYFDENGNRTRYVGGPYDFINPTSI